MPVDVVLNVYDLIEQTPICCGFFHTGVEIMGTEWSFAGGAGVYDCQPRSAPDGRFRESIVLGSVASTAAARSALDRVRPEFHGDAYSLIFRNCNDFSSAYVKALLGRDIPGWINRLARMGRAWPVRCFLPAHMKAGASGMPGDAPLLAGRQQASAPVLFHGAGNSLSGQGASASFAGGWWRHRWRCLASRVGGAFGGRAARPRSNDGEGLVLPGVGGDARELRAAAASRRLSGGPDAEAPEDNPRGQPMPNPWRQ